MGHQGARLAVLALIPALPMACDLTQSSGRPCPTCPQSQACSYPGVGGLRPLVPGVHGLGQSGLLGNGVREAQLDEPWSLDNSPWHSQCPAASVRVPCAPLRSLQGQTLSSPAAGNIAACDSHWRSSLGPALYSRKLPYLRSYSSTGQPVGL